MYCGGGGDRFPLLLQAGPENNGCRGRSTKRSGGGGCARDNAIRHDRVTFCSLGTLSETTRLACALLARASNRPAFQRISWREEEEGASLDSLSGERANAVLAELHGPLSRRHGYASREQTTCGATPYMWTSSFLYVKEDVGQDS